MLIVAVAGAECYPPLIIVSSLLLFLLCNDVGGGGYPAAIGEYHDGHDEVWCSRFEDRSMNNMRRREKISSKGYYAQWRTACYGSGFWIYWIG